MHSIPFLSQIEFDEFIAKGGELCIELVELLLTRWLREET
jgi:hypothetical protein